MHHRAAVLPSQTYLALSAGAFSLTAIASHPVLFGLQSLDSVPYLTYLSLFCHPSIFTARPPYLS